MIVVIAIIALLVGLVLPGAASMWKQRGEAATVNLVRGLLESARSQARRLGERGLLFFVDPIDNVQRVAFIEAEPPNELDRVECRCDNSSNEDCITPPMTVNRFRVTSDKVYTVPQPYRVAPQLALEWASIVDEGLPGSMNKQQRLGNDVFRLDGSYPAGLWHRNFFAVVFDRNGTLQIGTRPWVIVHDRDGSIDGTCTFAGQDRRGDKTKLYITQELLAAKQYYAPNGEVTLDPIGNGGLSHMIRYEDDEGIAASFPLVAGLVVYDDSVAEGLDGSIGGANRGEQAGLILAQELLANGRPIYVTRQTGDIIIGEKGR
jgi:type II secretory pathway pseudopilin PulG